MTELSVQTLRFFFAGCYAITFLAMLPLLGRTSDRIRSQSYLLAAVIVIAPVSILIQEFGVGQLSVGAGALDLVNLLQGLVSSVIIYWVVLSLVSASTRLIVVTVGVAVTPTFAAALAPILGSLTGVLGVLFLAGTFLPFPLMFYLFFGPIKRAATDVSRRRYLMHWKARNILLFTYGMLLIYTLVAIAGLVTDPLLNALVLNYTTYFLYAGVATYLVYNFSRLDARDAREMVTSRVSGPKAADGTD